MLLPSPSLSFPIGKVGITTPTPQRTVWGLGDNAGKRQHRSEAAVVLLVLPHGPQWRPLTHGPAVERAHEREDAVVGAAGGLEARDSGRQSPLRGPGDAVVVPGDPEQRHSLRLKLQTDVWLAWPQITFNQGISHKHPNFCLLLSSAAFGPASLDQAEGLGERAGLSPLHHLLSPAVTCWAAGGCEFSSPHGLWALAAPTGSPGSTLLWFPWQPVGWVQARNAPGLLGQSRGWQGGPPCLASPQGSDLFLADAGTTAWEAAEATTGHSECLEAGSVISGWLVSTGSPRPWGKALRPPTTNASIQSGHFPLGREHFPHSFV